MRKTGAGRATLPDEGSTGWSDTWMIATTANHPNCMYLWMDYVVSPAANAKATEYFGEAPVSAEACKLTVDRSTARSSTPRDEDLLLQGLLLDDAGRRLR